MATYIVGVQHTDRYELDAETQEQALSIARDCIVDNYGYLYLDNAILNPVRIDVPFAGDLTDAGLAGE
jgi:hypothetical protein